MTVYKVNTELSIDIGITTFTLHPGDHFEFNGENIEKLHYTTKIPWLYDTPTGGTFELNKDKLRLFDSIRIGNSTSWIPILECVGREIEDVTIQYNRDKILEKLLNK